MTGRTRTTSNTGYYNGKNGARPERLIKSAIGSYRKNREELQQDSGCRAAKNNAPPTHGGNQTVNFHVGANRDVDRKVIFEDEKLKNIYLEVCRQRDSIPQHTKKHIELLKAIDPVFAKRHKTFLSAVVCNRGIFVDDTLCVNR